MSAGHPAPGTGAAHDLPAQLIHDLRTPLGQIIGYTEMLMERAHEAGHAEYAPDLQKVHAASYRLLALLDQHFHAVQAPPAQSTDAGGTETPAPVPPR